MRRVVLAALLIVTVGAKTSEVFSSASPGKDLRGPLIPALASTVDPVVNALWSRFSGDAALEHVKFISQYWRLSGNAGYNATLDRVKSRMLESGFADGTAPASRQAASVWVEEYPNTGKGWNYSVGTLALTGEGGADEPVLTRENQNLSLCINSFSTPAAGVMARLVDAGRGREADFAGKDVTGAVVIGDADAGSLFQVATTHGAIGVVSTTLGRYISPDPPGAPATPRDQWNILQWGSIRYDEAKKGFAFKATPKAAARLRQAIASASADRPPNVRVTIASTFSNGPNRMVVAEIPGRSASSERVVVTAHVQEPGANDNASGVATLTELARAMGTAIRERAIPPPERTITFLWLEEISGSHQWLTTHADQAKSVRYMFSMDMTGEDVRKTGGSFLIERWPDPGAVWDRPWDPHTEWGPGNFRENQLKGDLLNDLHLAICMRVAEKTGWVVKTNPYEGGSDHSEFGRAGIPSVLDWHFTDRYYHSNYDTADKTSPEEMRNVGVSVAASAWLLASAGESTSLAVATLVAQAGQARIAIEEREGQKLAEADADPAAAKARETTIVQAWRKWYGEAIRSASRLVVGPVTPAFTKALEDLATALENRPRVSVSSSELTVEDLLLASDRLRAERWYPPVPGRMAPTPDEVVLQQALASPVVRLRAEAVRAVGRFENIADTPKLLPFLRDPDPTVRREAAQAVAQSLKQSRGAAVLPARAALQASIAAEKDPPAYIGMLEALARLRYDHSIAVEVAPWLAQTPGLLTILLRQDRQVRLDDDSVQALRRLTPGSKDALEALYLLDAVDLPLAMLDFHCIDSPICGWETRLLATQQLDVKQPTLAKELDTLRHDPALQVRLAAVAKAAAFIPTLQQCRPLIESAATTTEAPIVRLEAIRLMDIRCTEKDDIVALLIPLADGLGKPESKTAWHVPARAMEALVKFRPTEAKRVLDAFAVGHSVWQVRAAAARVGAALKDEAVLLALANDKEPNVRTEVVTGLALIKSQQVTRIAASALSSDDHQLVRASALALKGTAEPQVVAAPALLKALVRLTGMGKDNSRDARMAILDRLKEFARSVQPGDLQSFLRDYDPNVAAAAADVLGLTTGARPSPDPVHRAPEQPSAQELRSLPTIATIVFDTGDRIDLTLLPAEAPLAVYRFAKLAGEGHYDGLTFHRVVPLFVIQGGSPGANEYVGDARFMRDEIGFERHTRGAVGISTRGRDTGDGQIFVNLTDQPRLNYDYTIFARVSNAASLQAVDAVLEGTKIRSIRVGR
jgi:cyclophilin family peptidyl-prolyl cis-trans isomerase/Zn-dependent M28 family amino/carboxypeptidase